MTILTPELGTVAGFMKETALSRFPADGTNG